MSILDNELQYNIILLVSLIAVSLAATILGPYKAHPAFAATVDVSIPKGASTNPMNGFDPKKSILKLAIQ